MAGAGYRGRLENFARKARVKLIEAVARQAALYGLTEKEALPVTVTGSVATIGGRSFPAGVAEMQRELAQRIRRHGYARVIDEVAYTWFNRFAAIRYMELHGLLAHGYRVMSHPQRADGLPEILEHARELELPGLDTARVDELLMAGGREAELYQLLIVAHCNSLHEQMPFLFEAVHEASELLLPDRLLHTGSVMRAFVEELDEGDWQEIEVIGWLYQYYISEKKEAVIGTVVKSEDIPAATQLFTPNWIVKYMVQNSLGRQWMLANPDSGLRAEMAYYIEPGEQPPEAERAMREAATQSTEPEALTLLDPASGSGHILVEAYNLFKAIYLERGYLPREIPKLILEKNLFGLEIDERAAQLAAFALMMKARADDPRLFEKHVRPNILAIRESNEVNREQTLQALTRRYDGRPMAAADGEFDFAASEAMPLFFQKQAAADTPAGGAFSQEDARDLGGLLDFFRDAQTFGSLLRVPAALKAKVPGLTARLTALARGSEDLNTRRTAEAMLPFLWQAELLAKRFNAVVANPPYMGGGGMNAKLKAFAKEEYPDSKSDLCTMFIEHGLEMIQAGGFSAMVTMEVWMFLSSYEKLRAKLLDAATILSMVHMPYLGKGGTSMGINFGTVATVFSNLPYPDVKGHYCCVRHFETDDKGIPLSFPVINERRSFAASGEFKRIPGSPIAYWVSEKLRASFEKHQKSGDISAGKFGMSVADPSKIHYWYEVQHNRINFKAKRSSEFNEQHPFAPYDKGGEFRRWYGNRVSVINWKNDGHSIRSNPSSAVRNASLFCVEHLSWTLVTSRAFSARYFNAGFLLDTASNAIYKNDRTNLLVIAGILNSKYMSFIAPILNPTINFSCGVIDKVPIVSLSKNDNDEIQDIVTKCISQATSSWNAFEISWDFTTLPLLHPDYCSLSLDMAYEHLRVNWQNVVKDMQRLEVQNNDILIHAYGLQDELTPDVPLDEITLTCNPVYRYGAGKSEAEYEELQRRDTMKELVSYAIGCMMGRYSLDVPGLVYADSGNEGFDASKYLTFPADEDGILPLTEEEWFEDEAANRFQRFLRVTFGDEHCDENLRFVSEALGVRADHPLQAVRRYLATDFFKDHLRTYKKRPIYWLFSSGKERAFQCLVYLHRYNEGTLARMRTQYLIPLQGKIRMRIEQLEGGEGERKTEDGGQKTAGAAGRRAAKELDTLRKQADELRTYDEQMRHYADMRIRLELDDGVKVNYGKFGTLLANVKDVTGGGE